MLASKLIADAASSKNNYVTRSPSYYVKVSKAGSWGSVVFSNEETIFPKIDLYDMLVCGCWQPHDYMNITRLAGNTEYIWN